MQCPDMKQCSDKMQCPVSNILEFSSSNTEKDRRTEGQGLPTDNELYFVKYLCT